MTNDEYVLPDNAIDLRPGDTVLANLDGDDWRVILVQDVIALRRLMPFGERGSRRFVGEDLLRDSVAPAWAGEVHLLVRLFDSRFATAEEAGTAARSGQLGAATSDVCLDAARLTTGNSRLYNGEIGG